MQFEANGGNAMPLATLPTKSQQPLPRPDDSGQYISHYANCMNSKSNERYSGKGQKEMLKDGTKKIHFLVLDDINFFPG